MVTKRGLFGHGPATAITFENLRGEVVGRWQRRRSGPLGLLAKNDLTVSYDPSLVGKKPESLSEYRKLHNKLR